MAFPTVFINYTNKGKIKIERYFESQKMSFILKNVKAYLK